jgi:predicted lipoprotein
LSQKKTPKGFKGHDVERLWAVKVMNYLDKEDVKYEKTRQELAIEVAKTEGDMNALRVEFCRMRKIGSRRSFVSSAHIYIHMYLVLTR